MTDVLGAVHSEAKMFVGLCLGNETHERRTSAHTVPCRVGAKERAGTDHDGDH